MASEVLTDTGAFHGPNGEYDGQLMDTGFFVRFHTPHSPLDLFDMAVSLFGFIAQTLPGWSGQLPYLVCFSEDHRVQMQQALGLGVSASTWKAGEGDDQEPVLIGYRYELDTHSEIVQAEKRPRQRQER